jgi:hypothetical protein
MLNDGRDYEVFAVLYQSSGVSTPPNAVQHLGIFIPANYCKPLMKRGGDVIPEDDLYMLWLWLRTYRIPTVI